LSENRFPLFWIMLNVPAHWARDRPQTHCTKQSASP
jgi:hypothetical protein